MFIYKMQEGEAKKTKKFCEKTLTFAPLSLIIIYMRVTQLSSVSCTIVWQK